MSPNQVALTVYIPGIWTRRTAFGKYHSAVAMASAAKSAFRACFALRPAVARRRERGARKESHTQQAAAQHVRTRALVLGGDGHAVLPAKPCVNGVVWTRERHHRAETHVQAGVPAKA